MPALTQEEKRLIVAYRSCRRHQKRAIYDLAIASKLVRDQERAVAKQAKALIAQSTDSKAKA